MRAFPGLGVFLSFENSIWRPVIFVVLVRQGAFVGRRDAEVAFDHWLFRLGWHRGWLDAVDVDGLLDLLV